MLNQANVAQFYNQCNVIDINIHVAKILNTTIFKCVLAKLIISTR